MQQRRLRLGDILDDYCPRERRITNHAVVAMIDDQVKQTRCSTCDAEHEYKEARVPAARRRKDAGVLADPGEAAPRAVAPPDEDLRPDASSLIGDEPLGDAIAIADLAAADEDPPAVEDDGPVHRRLIRATLPRPEGQVPEWKEPEFTVRQPGRGGRESDGNRNGQGGAGGQSQRPGRHRRFARPGGSPGNAGGPPRFGGQRQGNSRPGGGQGPGQGQRPQGNRPGANRGSGRKRGR